MSEKKLRLLLVTVFLAAAIVSSGCRSHSDGLNTTMPSGNATPPHAALFPIFGQIPAASTTIAEPNGFYEYGSEPLPTGGSALEIDLNPPTNRTTPGPNLPTIGLNTSPGASDKQLAVREDSLLVGGNTPGGTRPGGWRLDILPRNNPEAADLLDHWGHRRNQALREGLSLTPPLTGKDTFDLQTPRAAAEKRSRTTIAPNLQDGDEVRVIGTRRGVTYGRWEGGGDIDYLFLVDLGVRITEETERPETYGFAGWTDYAAFTVSVSRDLQIALADPQPHYGNGGSRWSTLDVVDLLQADVDAFGYLSTGSFRQSHLEKGPDGAVRYAGGLLGAALDRTGLPPVTGDATLSVDLATLDGTASFTSLKVFLGGTAEVFADGSLHYPIELSANKILGIGPGVTFQADFYGPKHKDVAGVLHDPQTGLIAAFGATLDERPYREEVIASADFMAGLSYQHGSANPIDDGRRLYRCGTDASCEMRYDPFGPGGWSDWMATSRENALTSTAGWTWRNFARTEADYDFLRLERFTSASTDGARGRHVIDGLTGTLEHMAFGFGFMRSKNWETDAISDNFRNYWTGVQGTLSGSLLNGSARWTGLMVGYQRSYDRGENPFVEGRARVDFSLSSNLVDVKFSEVASRDGKRVLSDFGFEDLQAAADGTFRGGDEGIIRGAFFGPAQEEAGGMFHHNATKVIGSFGARRQESFAPISRADAAAPEQLAVNEDSLLTGGSTPSGTRPGGRRLDILPRNNPVAADLLDHWGHRRSQALVEGLSLKALAEESNAIDLQAPRAAAEKRSKTTITPNLQDGDEVRTIGTRRGVTFGRWAGGPADTLSIDFDLSGAGPLMSDDPAFRAMLERTGKTWSHRIADTWTPWERAPGEFKGRLVRGNPSAIRTQVRVGPEGEISTGLEIDVRYEDFTKEFDGRGGGGVQPRYDTWEPHFGSIALDTEFLQKNHGTSLIFNVLTHEIGHVLGAWTTHSYPERLRAYIDETSGAWTGLNVVALHGGPAPFQDASDAHAWVDGERDPLATNFDFAHSGVCASLMAYCNYESALPAFLPHAIDFAFLKDLGMTITEETERPETYGLTGWTDYAAFTVSVSRDLQIALADPQPHYGYYGDPWQTLDVVDLLQAEVDAFGYLSSGNFRSSFSAKGPDGTVRYVGGLLGAALDHSGLPPVTGDATISVELATLDGAASFTSLKVYPDGTPEIFASGSLHYPIELSANSIVGTAPGATFQADFYGPKHEDVAGVLHDPSAGLLAGFGATLDERPSREDVIASADYLAGLSRLINTPDPVDERWYQYRCGADASCEMRHNPTGPASWSDWMTATRENALASTAGWTWRNVARPEADYDSVRIERLTRASTDEARGRHVVDGYTGTMEHVAFGTGFEHYTNWTTEQDVNSPDLEHRWTSVQGTTSGGLPGGRARWSGPMLGYQYNLPSSENRLVEGRATVDFSLFTNLVDVMFTEVASRDGQRELPDFGFEGLLAQTDGTFARSDESGRIYGALFGPVHEEAGGTFAQYETDVFGSFGARREADTVTLEETGATRDHISTEGYIFYSYNQWGFWAKQFQENIFGAFLEQESTRTGSITTYYTPYGRIEGTPTGHRPVSGSAVWSGKVRAFETHLRGNVPISGNAHLEVDFSDSTIDIDFTDFEAGHSDMSWQSLQLVEGAFRDPQVGQATIQGAFYGTEHQGVAGTFDRDRLRGVFGARRE